MDDQFKMLGKIKEYAASIQHKIPREVKLQILI